jgi:ABC-2 type transport system permease protein
MVRYLQLFWWFALQQAKIHLEYRVNFAIGMASQLFIQFGGVAAVWVVMQHIPQINGWSFEEVLLIHGLLVTAFGLSFMFTNSLWYVGNGYIRTGAFDRFLVRPINPLFHLLVSHFESTTVGDLLSGATFVVVATGALNVAWTPLLLFYLVLAVLSGAAIFAATNLLTAVTAFWIVNSHPVSFVVFKTFEFAKFPLTIYPRVIRLILTWVIPYGLISFFPASYIVGRDVGVMAWAGVGVAAVMLFIGYRLWLFGLRHYTSTGS